MASVYVAQRSVAWPYYACTAVCAIQACIGVVELILPWDQLLFWPEPLLQRVSHSVGLNIIYVYIFCFLIEGRYQYGGYMLVVL